MRGERLPRKPPVLRRLAHPGRTWTFLVVCVAVAALAFGLGTLVRSPDSTVLEAREETIPVYAAVDSRAVTQDVRIQGEIVGSDTHPVHAELPEGASRAVVTNVAVEPGATVTNGALIGTVSDRPVFAFSLSVPLFRDLHAGDTGSDVSSLQEAMGVPVSGVMDWQTLQSVRDLYAQAGLLPPGGAGNGTFVRLSEFTSLPSSEDPPTVRTVAGIGTVLEPDTPLAQLSLGSSFVSVRASVSEADQITVGDEVSVQVPGGSVETGVVAAIGNFQPQGNEAGRPPGRDIRVELPEDSSLAAGQSASVLFGAASEPVTAVPTLAVRSDANGEYVLRRTTDKETQRVPVVVMRNANGWTALDAEELSVGDEVLVSS